MTESGSHRFGCCSVQDRETPAATATPTQSGDFEDSVAALQDADALEAAPFRFMAPMRVHCLEVEALDELTVVNSMRPLVGWASLC